MGDSAESGEKEGGDNFRMGGKFSRFLFIYIELYQSNNINQRHRQLSLQINYQQCMIHLQSNRQIQFDTFIITMLELPLDSQKHRKMSISSAQDQQYDQLKLLALVDEQKRTIRKLKLKVSKLEEILQKQRGEDSKSKDDEDQQVPNNPHYEMLKQQIEKSDILEGTVNKIAAKINQIALEIIPEAYQYTTLNPNFLSSTKMNTDLPEDNPENEKNTKHDFQTFLAINRCFQQLQLLHSAYIRLRELVIKLKAQNKQIKGSLKKSAQISKKVSLDIEQLREFKIQFQTERRNCVKLKKLLQKSEFERNRMMVKIDQMKLTNQENNQPNSDQLLKLSKSLTYKINNLQKEKSEIIRQNLKEKQSWAKKYKQFLRMLKQFKKH